MEKHRFFIVMILIILIFLSTQSISANNNDDHIVPNCKWYSFRNDIAHSGIPNLTESPYTKKLDSFELFNSSDNHKVANSIVFKDNTGYYVGYLNKVPGLYCITKKEINLLFLVDDLTNNYSTPLIINDKLIFSVITEKDKSLPEKEILTTPNIYCYDIVNQKIIWKKRIAIKQDNRDYPVLFYTSPTSDSNNLFLNGFISYTHTIKKGNRKINYPVEKDYLLKISIATGEILKIYVTIPGYFKKIEEYYSSYNSDAMMSSPIFVDDKVYFGHYGGLTCLDSVKMEKIWYFPAGTDTTFLCSPVYSNGFIYYGTYDRNLFCLDALKGTIKWAASLKDGIRNASCPVVYKDKVFIGAMDGKIACYDARNGQLLWWFQERDTINAVATSPIVVNDMLCIGTNDGLLYFFNIETGKVVQQHKLDAPIIATPSVGNGCIFVGTTAGTMYCLSESIGKIEIVGPTKLKLGEKTLFKLNILSPANEAINAHINWILEPSNLGSITNDGYFTPNGTGEVILKAQSMSGISSNEIHIQISD